MDPKIEKGDKQAETSDEVCFTLRGALERLPVNIPDDVWKVISVATYSLDARYYKHVSICIRNSEVDITISNVYVNHIDVCMSACLDAFGAAGCKKEGAATACYTRCRKLIRQDAYNSLYATYLELTNELKKLGYRFIAEFEEGDTPQQLKLTVWP